jgi:hypothetical protein
MNDPQFDITSTRICDLTPEQLNSMDAIFNKWFYDENKTGVENGYIHDPIDYRKLVEDLKTEKKLHGHPINVGRVFFASYGGEIVAFLLSFDSLELEESSQYPISLIERFLKHEFQFIQDLSYIGHFVFLSQIGKKVDVPGLGSYLIKAYEKFCKEPSYYFPKKVGEKKLAVPVLAAGVAHEGQFRMLRWFRGEAFGVLFVDFYLKHNCQNKKDEIYFRLVKILDNERFYERIKMESIEEAFKTIIPIQLSLSTRSYNALIKSQGATILWSSFFQYESPQIEKNLHLDTHYNGFYQTLLLAPNQEAHFKAIETLRSILTYLRKKDNRDTDEEVVSLSPKLKKDSFEFFLLEDDPERVSFDDFARPVAFQIQNLNVVELLKRKELRIGEGFDKLELWQKYINKASNIKGYEMIQFSEEEWQYLERIRREKLLSDREFEELAEIEERINHNIATTTEQERAFREEVKERRTLSQELAQKWEDWIALHQQAYETDKLVMHPKQKWCHVIVPFSFIEGVYGVTLTIAYEPREADKKWLNHLVLNAVNSISRNMFNIIVRLQKAKNKRTLMKYAIATISTRNLAHHFGSHVLSKLSEGRNLKKFVTVLKDNDFDVSGISKFLIYLRSRMDFLADLSTSEPVTSVSKYLLANIILPFQEEAVINRFISGSQVDQIIIEYSNKLEGADIMDDVIIQLPTGNLGAHALYLIFENIIRNTIKHTHDEIPAEGLKLHIDVVGTQKSGETPRGYLVRIYDNIPQKKEDLKKKVIEKINQRYILSHTIESNRKLRSAGWGISEMKMAASYLRKKVPSEHIDDSKVKPPLLKAVMEPVPGMPEYGYLAYEIYLKVPRKMVIIDSQGFLNKVRNRSDWYKQGVKVLSSNELKGKAQWQIHSHDLVVLLEDINRHELETEKTFPLRWVKMLEPQKKQQLKDWLEQDVDLAFNQLWEIWLETYLHNKELEQRTFYTALRSDREPETDETKQNNQLLKSKDPKDVMLFDLHADAWKKGLVRPDECWFYEFCGSKSPTGILIEELEFLKKFEKERLFLEFSEAACTEVLVLDERIQLDACSYELPGPHGDVRAIDALKWMRISIPELEYIDLYKSRFSKDDRQRIVNWLKDQLCTKKIDFCIIHMGLIEKLSGSTPEEIQQFVDDCIKKHNDRAEIVVTSGRGKPHQLPKKSLFLNYSNLAKYILEERSKYHLCKILFSARTRLEGYEI